MIDSESLFASARSQLLQQIEAVTPATFGETALSVFRWQAEHNPVYRSFLHHLGVKPEQIASPEAIPCLPISFFKTHSLQTGTWTPQTVFRSSGTTGTTTSRHPVRDTAFYERNAQRGFEAVYGPLSQYTVLALLPAYLERSDSSLVFMADYFIRQSTDSSSGFFLHDYDQLATVLRQCAREQKPTLLLGVSFALWDMAERYQLGFEELVVMETGGMKGRRKELTRAELHAILAPAFRQKQIHSEYGMTELLSQAYSPGEGRFYPAPTMRVCIRDMTDPLTLQKDGRTGAINVIDLANLDTVSFIATDDLGRRYADGSFEVLGRLDAADIRGCNLLTLDG